MRPYVIIIRAPHTGQFPDTCLRAMVIGISANSPDEARAWFLRHVEVLDA